MSTKRARRVSPIHDATGDDPSLNGNADATDGSRCLPLQRLHRLSDHVLPHTECFHSSLLHFFQCANLADVRLRTVAGPELAGTPASPAALCVNSWASIASGSSCEDGGLASFEGGWWDVEDKLETGDR